MDFIPAGLNIFFPRVLPGSLAVFFNIYAISSWAVVYSGKVSMNDFTVVCCDTVIYWYYQYVIDHAPLPSITGQLKYFGHIMRHNTIIKHYNHRKIVREKRTIG